MYPSRCTMCKWEGPDKDIGGYCSENLHSLERRNTGHTKQFDCRKANEGLREPKCTWIPICPKCTQPKLENKLFEYPKWVTVFQELTFRHMDRQHWWDKVFGKKWIDGPA